MSNCIRETVGVTVHCSRRYGYTPVRTALTEQERPERGQGQNKGATAEEPPRHACRHTKGCAWELEPAQKAVNSETVALRALCCAVAILG